ncbi:MAG: alpha/beta fold hydrolase [Mycobacteriales bacterium]
MSLEISAPDLVIVEHEFDVPLDHDDPSGQAITVFAREVAEPGGRDRPVLVFLQGGPGHESPRPTSRPFSPRWLERALADFRVLFLDQRGTGRSTPIGVLPGLSAQAQADYLAHFRADSIVRDAEFIRTSMGLPPWSILGQSFGGFCAVSYLSMAPDGLREAFITGGLPPVDRHTDEMYAATYDRILERNHRYYARYPGDRATVHALHEHVDSTDVRLPDGDRLTSRRLRQLGNLLGMSDGAERLHYLLELPADSPAFLHDVSHALPYSRNPLYAAVHEACAADGCATRWSADRLLPSTFTDNRELFFGEHVFPWMFDDYGALAPLRDAANLLADREWPALYDAEQLQANEVPAAAAVYVDDPYVELRFSTETAALIRGLRPWVTNEYEHNGLRADGGRILDRLIGLARSPG